MLSSVSDKANLFAKSVSKNSSLDDFGIYSLFCFPFPVFLTDLELRNISVIPKVVKKVILNLDSSKVSSWLYSICGSKELWAWPFINTNWTLQYMSQGVLFFRLLKGLISGPSNNSVHPHLPTPICWRRGGGGSLHLNLQKEGLDRISIFRGRGRGGWEGGGDFFHGGCSFYIKHKLKSEVFSNKKVYKQKCFSLS